MILVYYAALKQAMRLHSYYVRYIERCGRTSRRLVMAQSAAEAREKASADGCEDILGVKRARFVSRTLLRLLVLATFVSTLAAVCAFCR